MVPRPEMAMSDEPGSVEISQVPSIFRLSWMNFVE